MATTRLYVGNLAFNTTAEHLQAAFSPFGTVVANLVVDTTTGRNRGSGSVTIRADEAQRAIAQLNGTTINGRALMVFLDPTN